MKPVRVSRTLAGVEPGAGGRRQRRPPSGATPSSAAGRRGVLTIAAPGAPGLPRPVDHSAQITSRGWKSRRMPRARSVSRPKASVPRTNCSMLPGKIATKKAATIQPTATRHRRSRRRARPSAISTTPDATTVMSTGSGTQDGTCATNSPRANVRCAVPANSSAAPSSQRASVRGCSSSEGKRGPPDEAAPRAPVSAAPRLECPKHPGGSGNHPGVLDTHGQTGAAGCGAGGGPRQRRRMRCARALPSS